MGIRLDTTEQEFGVALGKAFAGRIGAGDIAAIVRGFKKLLDLEFQEPEVQGEGMPEELPEEPLRISGLESGTPVIRSGLSAWLDLSHVDACTVLTPCERQRLQLLVDTANQVSALLALARELEEELHDQHSTLEQVGQPTPDSCSTCLLLARARAFLNPLDPLEGGRE